MATVTLLNSMYFYVTAASGAVCLFPEYDKAVSASIIIIVFIIYSFYISW